MHEVHLPAEPLVVIQPSNRWSILSFADVWAYRELLFFLTWRDVKVRYKQTALGAAWALYTDGIRFEPSPAPQIVLRFGQAF